MLFRPCVHNAQRKIGEASLLASPAGYTYGKAVKRSPKDWVVRLHLRPCLVPFWCGTSRTALAGCWSWGAFIPKVCFPAFLSRG